MRLDSELVRRGLAGSRERAKEYVASGIVKVNGLTVKKAAAEVNESDIIEMTGETLKYVGRGGLKLEGAVKAFKIDASGLTCLDIGASTGGFTDCLLQFGAKKVYASDVGHGQLAKKLLDDERVVNMEGVNVKDFTADTFSERIDFGCSDLSFISVKYAVKALSDILSDGGSGVFLVKPQFEAGKSALTKTGIVLDKKVHVKVLRNVCAYVQSLGFNIRGLIPSPIKGGDGNREYLLYAVKQDSFTSCTIDIEAVVKEAFGR